VDYYCDYENGEDHDIFQGPRSTDEMCMLIGSYYPADPATANCLEPESDHLAAEWVGNREASCAQTLDCISSAGSDSPDSLDGLTSCMDQADPAVAAAASNAVRARSTRWSRRRTAQPRLRPA